MDAWANIISTALWVALFGAIVWRFHRPIHSLLSAVAARLETGASVKVGSIELGEIVRPQPPEEQRTRLAEEIKELGKDSLDASKGDRQSLKSMYLQAEDLALRAIQAEYGEPLRRQVSFGQGVNVDAFFVRGNVPYVVEVKYSIHRLQRDVVRRALEQVADYRKRTPALAHARFILVLVRDQEENLTDGSAVRQLLSDYPFDVEIKNYSLPELVDRFGAKE